MKIDKEWIIIIILFIIAAFLTYKVYVLNEVSHTQVEEIHKQDNEKNRYTIIYYDQTIESLKKRNKELYDSIKIFKEQIDYLINFKYEKEYIFDTIYCDTTKHDSIHVYEYENNDNDTLTYNLKIGSVVEPNWYKFRLKLQDEFTIINTKDGKLNNTTIESNNGNVSDVTIIKTNKTKFLDNFVIGPSINAGYDVINKNFGINVGFSVTYKIPLK